VKEAAALAAFLFFESKWGRIRVVIRWEAVLVSSLILGKNH